MVPSPNRSNAERTSGIPYNAGYGGYGGYGEYVVMHQGTGEEQRLGFQAGAAGFSQRYQQQQGIAAMAGRPPSSAGGGGSNPQLYNPQQFATSTGAVTPMMMVQQQQQQQQQQQRPGQQQLQQRATPVGQQQQQQIRAGPYQQQQYVHHMASAPSVNQVRPGPQGTTGAGTPHYANMSMTQQQNMQVRQKANQVQTPYMGALPQQNLGASRQGVPLTSQQQQQQQQVQQQQVLHNQQQLTQQRLGTPQQQAMVRQTHGQQMLQNPGNTMLARASSTGAQMQGVPTQQSIYAMAKTPQYQQPQQPQQQARPQMVPTSLATNNQARPGTPGAAAQPQNSLPSSAPAATAAPTEPLDATRSILSKRSIQDLLAQIDPRETLDPDVEDLMLEIADDFIESVASFSVKLAKHRKSDVLEAKDVMLHLERQWNISVPGFGGDEYRSYKRPSVSETHKQRLAVVRKSAAAGQAAAVDTKSSSLLASAPGAVNASTPVKPAGAAAGSPSPSPGMPRIPRV